MRSLVLFLLLPMVLLGQNEIKFIPLGYAGQTKAYLSENTKQLIWDNLQGKAVADFNLESLPFNGLKTREVHGVTYLIYKNDSGKSGYLIPEKNYDSGPKFAELKYFDGALYFQEEHYTPLKTIDQNQNIVETEYERISYKNEDRGWQLLSGKRKTSNKNVEIDKENKVITLDGTWGRISDDPNYLLYVNDLENVVTTTGEVVALGTKEILRSPYVCQALLGVKHPRPYLKPKYPEYCAACEKEYGLIENVIKHNDKVYFKNEKGVFEINGSKYKLTTYEDIAVSFHGLRIKKDNYWFLLDGQKNIISTTKNKRSYYGKNANYLIAYDDDGARLINTDGYKIYDESSYERIRTNKSGDLALQSGKDCKILDSELNLKYEVKNYELVSFRTDYASFKNESGARVYDDQGNIIREVASSDIKDVKKDFYSIAKIVDGVQYGNADYYSFEGMAFPADNIISIEDIDEQFSSYWYKEVALYDLGKNKFKQVPNFKSYNRELIHLSNSCIDFSGNPVECKEDEIQQYMDGYYLDSEEKEQFGANKDMSKELDVLIAKYPDEYHLYPLRILGSLNSLENNTQNLQLLSDLEKLKVLVGELPSDFEMIRQLAIGLNDKSKISDSLITINGLKESQEGPFSMMGYFNEAKLYFRGYLNHINDNPEAAALLKELRIDAPIVLQRMLRGLEH